MRGETFWRGIYNASVTHKPWSAAISTMPGWFFGVVEILGKQFGWVDGEGIYPGWLYGILIALFVISGVYNILFILATSYDNEAKKSTQEFLTFLLTCVNDIKHAKVERFAGYIDRNSGERGKNPFADITQPRDQINSILKSFQLTLANITKVAKEDISLSVVYKTKYMNNWDWLAHLDNNNDLQLPELLSNPHSTVNQIISGKTDMVFIADKKKGIESNQYVASARDATSYNIGSIVCKKIGIGTSGNYISSILSIATYGLQLCDENDQDAITNITKRILTTFERRLQLEIALVYIKDVMALPARKKRITVTNKAVRNSR